MPRNIKGRGIWLRGVVCLLLALGGEQFAPPVQAAQGEGEFEAGQQAEARGDYDEALRQYQVALQADPQNPQYLVATERARFQAAAQHVQRGHRFREQGNLADAALEYEIASAIDPSSPVARQGLEQTRRLIQEQQGGGAVPDTGMPALEEALGPPQLRPLYRGPYNLRTTGDSKVVYETIGRLAGINVLFEPTYNSQRITVDLNNVSLEEALKHLSLLTTTFWKPVSQNTILVIPDTAVKRREQEQHVIKTFYLSNTITPQELTEVVTAIRTLLETRRIQQINSMNAIMLRDTPDKVALAEKIIRDVDKAKAEVVVDVAVLEVRRDKARQLGLGVGSPGLQIPLVFNPGGQTGENAATSIPLDRLDNLSTGDYSITLPGAQLNALLTDSNTRILQRPEVRASDGMRATLRIGDRVPIATGAYQPGVAGQAVSALVQTQFQYVDVGVNVDITPKVHVNREITLKVRVEVSAVTQFAEPVPGVRQPVIGQRIIEHDIRLREGEINILGGILQSQTTEQVSGIPGLSQIPLLRYLFSNVTNNVAEDEVLIVLRPHAVRVLDLTPVNLRALDIGTEGDVRLREPSETVDPSALPPAEPAAPAAPPAGQQTPTPPAAAVRPEGQAYARFLLLDSTPPSRVGESFEMTLRIEGAQDVFSIPFELIYDPAALRLVSVRQGAFLAPDGMPVAVVERPTDLEGRTMVSLTRPPGSGGVSGTDTVAVLTFEAVQAGTASVGILPAGVHTPANGFVPVEAAQATVTIR
jgi:general secretion pathway protein D